MAVAVYPPYFDSTNIAYRNVSYLKKVNFNISLNSPNGFDSYLLESNGQGYIECLLKDNSNKSILKNSSTYIYKAPLEKKETNNKKTVTIGFSSADFDSSYFTSASKYLNKAIKLSVNLFSSEASPKIDSSMSDSAWRNSNLKYISNGSGTKIISIISDFNNVCFNNKSLFVLTPTLFIDTGFEDNEKNILSADPIGSVTSGDLSNFSTTISFKETQETDQVSQFRLRYFSVKEKAKENVIYDSYYCSASSNKIAIKPSFIDNELSEDTPTHYYIQLDIITKKGFQGSFAAVVSVTKGGETEDENLEMTVTPDPDICAMQISFEQTNTSGNFQYVLQRASYATGFANRETLYVFEKGQTKGSYIDMTIESGTMYQYTLRNITNTTSFEGKTSSKEICLFDAETLTAEGQTLILNLDSKITGYKRNISETKIETIGSQFPFVRRNGQVNYRQFTLEGLISILGDENYIFRKKEQIWKTAADEQTGYPKFNQDNGISDYNDFFLEREFRNEVLNFLHKDTIKLFRSLPEGNILVKLMDIQLIPNETLGRLIYSFSCTAYEVAEATLENMEKYNIIDRGAKQ